jgi:hypothetical protein
MSDMSFSTFFRSILFLGMPSTFKQVATTQASAIPMIEVIFSKLTQETFTVLDPGEMVRYTYRVSILPEYTWGDEPAIRASCFFRTEDTNVTLPDKTLIFTRDPRKKFQQQDIKRQEAGYR